MIKSDKKIRDLSAILDKDDDILISEAIVLLREEQPFEGAIGLLVAYYDRSDNTSVRKLVEEFLNDLKDQSAAREIITEIKKPFNPSTISMLVSSCWQSGLNYSQYTSELAEVFLRGDYVTAIECLTVIEDSVNELSPAKKEEIIRIIKENPFPLVKEKKELGLELIAILSSE
jgi:predicted metal-dependent hydrolase